MHSRSGRSHDVDGVLDAPGSVLAGDELAEVRIIAADPDVAQRVAHVLRQVFPCDEPRSYPTGPDGRGTLLHLTVDTARATGVPSVPSPWLDSSRSQARRTHTDEPG
jgi:hypothetical protein